MPKGAKSKLPLKIGIEGDLIAAMPDTPEELIIRALRDYYAGAKYAAAMVAGSVRVDLDGNPAGYVSKRAETFVRAAHRDRIKRRNEAARRRGAHA